LAFYGALKHKARDFHERLSKKIAPTFHGVPKQIALGIHERSSTKKMRLASNFWCQKLEAERIFCVQMILKNFEKAKHKFSCVQPLLEFMNSKLESSKTCQTQINLHLAPVVAFELQVQNFHNMSNVNKFVFGPYWNF
jgi:hypothetical protein